MKEEGIFFQEEYVYNFWGVKGGQKDWRRDSK